MNLLIFILCVYGLTNIVTREYIFKTIRERVSEYFENDYLATLLSCPTCFGFWSGIILSFLLPYNFFLCGLIGTATCNLIEIIKNKF